jgi:hypothetical protein
MVPSIVLVQVHPEPSTPTKLGFTIPFLYTFLLIQHLPESLDLSPENIRFLSVEVRSIPLSAVSRDVRH